MKLILVLLMIVSLSGCQVLRKKQCCERKHQTIYRSGDEILMPK